MNFKPNILLVEDNPGFLIVYLTLMPKKSSMIWKWASPKLYLIYYDLVVFIIM